MKWLACLLPLLVVWVTANAAESMLDDEVMEDAEHFIRSARKVGNPKDCPPVKIEKCKPGYYFVTGSIRGCQFYRCVKRGHKDITQSCTHEGKTYKVGEVIENKNSFPLPCYTLRCTEKGVQRSKARCTVKAGQRSDVSMCHIHGDPHYTTFDGVSYDYMGPCEYYVVKSCNSFPGGNMPYAKWFITAKNEFSNQHGGPTNIEYITIHVRNPKTDEPDIIHIGKYDDGINVEINNIYLHTPSIPCDEGRIGYKPLPDFEYCMTEAGGFLEITNTRLQLKIHYNFGGLKIWLDDKMYRGHMCGLCGYFDGNPDNEYKLGPNPYDPNTSLTRFGDYYELPGCPTNKKEAVSTPAIRKEEVEIVKHVLEDVINSKVGKSSGCSAVMKPDVLYTYAYDVIASCAGVRPLGPADKRKCFCAGLENYFAECDDRLDANRKDSCIQITPECPKVYNRQYCSAKCPPARYLRNCKPGSCKKGYNCKMEMIKNCPHYQCVECGRDGNRNCLDDKME